MTPFLLSDLHMRNVLVMKRFYDDSQFPTEYRHMVADFGNAKQIETQNLKLDQRTAVSSLEQLGKDSRLASHGKNLHGSQKADIDKFRILALDLIALQRQHGPKMQSAEHSSTSVPVRLKHLLEACSRELDQRPTMRDVIKSLELLENELDKTEWQEIKPGAVLGAETEDPPSLLGNIVIESFSCLFQDSTSE